MKIDGLSSPTLSDKGMKDFVTNRVEITSLTEQQDKQLSIHMENDKKELSKEEAEHVIKGMNEFLKPKFTSLNFKMHEELDRYYVEVVDQETKKVIREIPSKELLDMYAKMTEFLGIFIDKKL
ncbi:flagellar protein FlaG [Bacillus sp. S/N-304-OC-R1]|uniref:flagellar protein FlaG n=1 Tax=Bacillus sp. S/N-304-OC-R1 TaxID=2758034 RepID=UPI001C8D987D|nr:flagellar protein FlaG [Bacillus sp. S/N-304-OC-R1]MBY0123447.1 flagellar protein FlaG [Bacillus sp. S/N-304-OC-R1]